MHARVLALPQIVLILMIFAMLRAHGARRPIWSDLRIATTHPHFAAMKFVQAHLGIAPNKKSKKVAA